jgi:hypothetical protein
MAARPKEVRVAEQRRYRKFTAQQKLEVVLVRDARRALAQRRLPRAHLPSPSPYRKRWKSWEGALLHFGYTPERTAQRFDQR